MLSIKNSAILQRKLRLLVLFPTKKCTIFSTDSSELKQFFPKPKEQIDEILKPLLKVNHEEFQPALSFEHMKYTKRWKCRLDMKWPRNFHVVGVAPDPNDAENDCYLQACDMLKAMGILNNYGNMTEYKKLLIAFHDTMCEFNINDFKKMTLKFDSKREMKYGKKVWTSSVSMLWPIEFCGQAVGTTQFDAENYAAASLFVKLNAHNLLKGIMAGGLSHITIPKYNVKNSEHSHTLYVDASMKGYGAYLVSNSTETELDIPWYFHPWDSAATVDLSMSSYIEFYAVCGAVFTWKHHFKDKTILVCSDNTMVVSMIENGLNISSLNHNSHFKEMYLVLCYACLANRITIQAKHIVRWDNIAADYLSKQKVELFHRLIPQASKQMKKPKFLHFIKPFRQ